MNFLRTQLLAPPPLRAEAEPVRNPAREKAREPAIKPPASPRKRQDLWILLLPLLLYAAALNPHFLPASYDDIVYYSGAVSIAEEGAFKFAGRYISDWPPMFSVLLALPFLLFGGSVLLGKGVVLGCAVAGLLLARRLFRLEQRPFARSSLLIFALLPASFLMGTRIMGEWPYFLASIAFLLVLQRLNRPDPPLRLAFLAGTLLGMAALTKFTGVLLGAAVLAQVAVKLRTGPRPLFPTLWWRRAGAEVITALIGGAAFLLWKAKIAWQVQAGTAAPSEYYRSGWTPDSFGNADVLSVPLKISDLFFHSDAVISAVGSYGWVAAFLFVIPGLVVLLGLATRLASPERSPSDWYAASLIALFAVVGGNQQTRYLMPVAPFLVGYGFIGCKVIANRLRNPLLSYAQWPRHFALGAWGVLLAASCFQLLLSGNLSGTHRGLCYAVSQTPESFYLGFWRDLYNACSQVRNDSQSGPLAVIGDEDKYVAAFSGRERVEFAPGTNFAFLLVLGEEDLDEKQAADLNLEPVGSYATLHLYRKDTPHL